MLKIAPLVLAAAATAAIFTATGSSRPVRISYASPSWSPDGRQLVFVSARGPEGAVLLAQANGRNVRRLLRAPFVTRVVWSPDGSRLAYVTRGRVVVAARDGTRRRDLGAGAGVAWSPDSSRIAFDSGWKGPIRVADADGTGVRAVTGGAYDRAPSWSPDGRRLMFTRTGGPGQAESLYVVDSDGSDLRTVGVQGADATWSPDGSRIAYWLRLRDGVALAVVDAGSLNGSVITRSLPAYSGPPRWSRDGTRLAFSPCGEFGACRVDVADAEGRDVRILGSGAEPAWSPDGTRVAFTGRRACRSSSIFTINPDGERLARVTRCR